jgi:acyl-CoA reductase-like NAD-dependent aldehyde dehydrogenase
VRLALPVNVALVHVVWLVFVQTLMYYCLQIVHESLYDDVVKRLDKAYASVMNRIGDPLESNILIGPMHTKQSVDMFVKAVEAAKQQGGQIHAGGKVRVIWCNGFYLFCSEWKAKTVIM